MSTPPPTLHRTDLEPGNLRARTGEPCGAVRESDAFLQPFSGGLLLWRPDDQQLILLHADGRVGRTVSGMAAQALGEPLAPAARVTLRQQGFQHATLLWTDLTGAFALFSQRWLLPLEVAA